MRRSFFFYIGNVGLVYVDCKVVNSMPNKTLYSKQKIIHTYNILSSLDILPSLKERDSVVIGNCLRYRTYATSPLNRCPDSNNILCRMDIPLCCVPLCEQDFLRMLSGISFSWAGKLNRPCFSLRMDCFTQNTYTDWNISQTQFLPFCPGCGSRIEMLAV